MPMPQKLWSRQRTRFFLNNSNQFVISTTRLKNGALTRKGVRLRGVQRQMTQKYTATPPPRRITVIRSLRPLPPKGIPCYQPLSFFID